MNHARVPNPPALLALTCVAALLTLVAPASASRVNDAWELIDAMPADARLVVVADDLSANLATPAGRALQGAIAESGFFSPTLRQWSELSDRLGLSPQEAVDALLGRRVVFVARELSLPAAFQPADESAWALMVWIPSDTEKRIRKRLQLAPRSKIAGQPVLAAEQGDFALVLLATKDAAHDDHTILLLAPASDDSMLEPMIRALLQRPDAPTRVRRAAPARPQPMPGSFLHIAGRATHASFELEARPTAAGWESRFTIDSDADHPHKAGSRPVSAARFQALAPDALALIMESTPDRVDPDLKSTLTASALFADLPDRFLRLMGGRSLVMLQRAGPATPGLCLTLASEATYPGNPVTEGDRAIGAMLNPGSGASLPEGSIEGQYPRAIRSEPLRANDASLFGDRPIARWAYSSPDPNAGSDPQTWWTLRLAPEQSHAAQPLREFVDALARRPREPDDARYIALGLVRPAALRRALGDTIWTAVPPVRAISRVERVAWSLSLADQQRPTDAGAARVLGHAQLDMRLDDNARP